MTLDIATRPAGTSTLPPPDAVSAFIGQKLRAEDLLALIGRHIEQHLGTDPEGINWGDVGTIAAAADLLQRAATMLGLVDEGA